MSTVWKVVLCLAFATTALVAFWAVENWSWRNHRYYHVLADTRNQVGMLEEAVRAYQMTVGSYPPNLDALVAKPAGLPPEKWLGPYLTKGVPLDRWGHSYQYTLPGKRNPCFVDVWTVTPDGEEIGNWGLGFETAAAPSDGTR
jgi:type II secretion system protein G